MVALPIPPNCSRIFPREVETVCSFISGLGLFLFAPFKLSLDSLADKFRPLVLAYERVNSLGHAFRQPHKNRLHF